MDDEVVDQSVIRFKDDYIDDEQDERRDLLYRNSRSAIERARQRHLQRRQQPLMPDEDEEQAAPDDDVVLSEGEESPESVAASLEPPVFEPDDFVEEESPASNNDVNDDDDALLSEGIRTMSPRALRLRRLREERQPPKEPEATKIEPEPDDVEPVPPSSAAPDRGRFDSIPEISAEIDLPLLRRSSSANRVSLTVTPEEPTSDVSPSYERALKRAHAMNAAARAEQNVQHRRETSTAAMMNTAADPAKADVSLPSMPDLPDEDSRTASAPRRHEDPALNAVQNTAQPLPEKRRLLRAPAPQMERRGRPDPAQARQERPRTKENPGSNWWRGHRVASDASQAASAWPEPVVTHQRRPVALPREQEHESPGEAVELTQAPVDSARLDPARLSFDLEDEKGLESFRDRLFSPAPEHAESAAAAHRSPITVSRRSQKPFSPASRERYRAEHQPDTEERGNVVLQPRQQPQPRVERLTDAQPHQRHIAPEELLGDPEDAWYEPEAMPEFDVRGLVEGESGLLDMTIEIAPQVKRECASCRSYRPSEQPGRGWCTNTWAFTHRQMVNEADLPCDSTIGCWWLPADEEVWLDDFEVASEATPRVDRLVAHLNPERRAVGN